MAETLQKLADKRATATLQRTTLAVPWAAMPADMVFGTPGRAGQAILAPACPKLFAP